MLLCMSLKSKDSSSVRLHLSRTEREPQWLVWMEISARERERPQRADGFERRPKGTIRFVL